MLRVMIPLAVAFALTATPSHAAKDAARDAARALYERAQQTYDRGEIAAALTLYLQAYETKALPGFLFNIAQCHRQLRNYERASFYFKRYLDLAPTTPNAQVVRDLITEVEAKQAELEEHKRADAAAARSQQVELARIAAAQAEKESDARRLEASNVAKKQELELATARAIQEKPPVVEAAPSSSVLTKWWLWAGVGVVVAGAAGAGAYVATAPSARPTTLGTDSAR